MKAKTFGIVLLLVGLIVYLSATAPGTFLRAGNLENLLERTALYGLLGIGVAFVIITAGIDLSIGSIVCLAACLLAMFLRVDYTPPDEHHVIAVEAAEQRIILRAGVTTFKNGDRIQYYGGRRAKKAIVQIREVDDVSYTMDGRSFRATQLTVDQAFSRDDTLGQIAKVYALVAVSPSGDGANGETRPPSVTIAGDHAWIRARDQVAFVHAELGLKTLKVLSAERRNGDTRVELNGDVDDLSTDWLVIPRKRYQRMPIVIAVLAVLAIAALLGLVHGLLVTKMKLQSFVVTLCGLLIYRGLARWLVNDQPQGFLNEYDDSLRVITTGKLTLLNVGGFDFGIPYAFFLLIGAAILAAVFLNKTIWGRYMLALGRNEDAARYSGINTTRVIIVAYIICTVMAATGGMLFALDSNSISPSSFGNFFELFAIAAAVLGGCSLRGGEGTILGVVIGTAVMQVLRNLVGIQGIPDSFEPAIIGIVILVGVIADELLKRLAAQRLAMRNKRIASEKASEVKKPGTNDE